jgi:excisionase family DNA binding protein
MTATAQRRLVSIPEACELLGGVSRTTLYGLVKRGELTQARIGRRGFVTVESIDGYVARSIQQPGD